MALCFVFLQCAPSKILGPEKLLGKWEGKATVLGADGNVRTGSTEVFLDFQPKTVKIEYVLENVHTIELNYMAATRNGILELKIGDGEVYRVSFRGADQMYLNLNEADRRRADAPLLSILTYRKIDGE
jgi:putative component of toxin-antitoxin plasmid stabilization module